MEKKSNLDNSTTIFSGHLAGIDEEGRVLFQQEDTVDSPVPVTIGILLSDGALVKAARLHQRALVMNTDTVVEICLAAVKECLGPVNK